MAYNVQFAEFAVMRVIAAVCLLFASPALFGARPLNPLVPRVSSDLVVTTECAAGAAPAAAPRIDVADLPEPQPSAFEAVAYPPPSSGLRVQLHDAQTALEREDRRAFTEALARIHATLADYPAGGERTAAQNVLSVYDDVAVLWDAQFQSPFFGEGSAAYRAASSYPGWQEGVRRNVLVDDRDRRFYPARESRQYLAGLASTGLKRLGVATATASATTTSALPSIRPKRRPGKIEHHETEASEAVRPTPAPPRRKAPAAAAVSRPAPKKVAAAAPPVVDYTPPPPPVQAPVTATTAPPPPVATPAPVPVTVPPPDTASTTALGETTDTSLTTSLATDSATTSAAPTVPPVAGEPAKGRRLIIPILLILVGLGVLIVLFRTSS